MESVPKALVHSEFVEKALAKEEAE